MKTLYKMKLHEQIEVVGTGVGYRRKWSVTRVPGGWIYIEDNENLTRTPISLFIPRDSEFTTPDKDLPF